MWEWLRSQGWDEMVWLVIVPAALILTMILAGIYNSVHR
jgi:hypothetical protein